jgi:hypothetical protein
MEYYLRIAQLAILSKTWRPRAFTQVDRVRIRIIGAIAGETMVELEAPENFDLALARGSSIDLSWLTTPWSVSGPS